VADPAWSVGADIVKDTPTGRHERCSGINSRPACAAVFGAWF
jgi:hypothetical protein